MQKSWLKQDPGRPLFPEVLWSRPENKRIAGKLMIAGGNLHSFRAPAEAAGSTVEARAGAVRVLLPDALRKHLGKLVPQAQFLPSTPSGSFAQSALSDLLEVSGWADGTLLVGDFGRNSETAILLETFLQKNQDIIVLTGDSLEYFYTNPDAVLNRPNSLIVGDIPRLQKLLAAKVLLKQSMDLSRLVDTLAELTTGCFAHVATIHSGQVVAASAGRVSTTPTKDTTLEKLSAYSGVFWIQNPANPFKAISSAAIEYQK